MQKYKKETWHVRPDYGKENVYRIWDGDDNFHDDTTPEAMDRRATLIEAAPAMLDALRATLLNARCPDDTDWPIVVKRLRAVISLAEKGA